MKLFSGSFLLIPQLPLLMVWRLWYVHAFHLCACKIIKCNDIIFCYLMMMCLCFMWNIPNYMALKYDVMSFAFSVCVISGVRGESRACGYVFFVLFQLTFLGGHVLNWCERAICR